MVFLDRDRTMISQKREEKGKKRNETTNEEQHQNVFAQRQQHLSPQSTKFIFIYSNATTAGYHALQVHWTLCGERWFVWQDGARSG